MKSTDGVLSYLEDEQSKFIYQKRVEYNETGDFNAIRAITERYLPQLKDRRYYPGMEVEMLERLKNKSRIVLFGSGMNGRSVLHYLIAHGMTVACFADNDKNKWGTKVEGVEIICPRDLDYGSVDAVVISPYEQVFVDAIRSQLLELGAREEILLNYKDFCPTMLEWEQYFDPDIIKLHEKEVFVDAGVLNLGTSLRFMEECRKNHIITLKFMPLSRTEHLTDAVWIC